MSATIAATIRKAEKTHHTGHHCGHGRWAVLRLNRKGSKGLRRARKHQAHVTLARIAYRDGRAG